MIFLNNYFIINLLTKLGYYNFVFIVVLWTNRTTKNFQSELRSKKFCILIILDLLRKINDNTIEFVKREKNVDTEENNTKFNNNIRLMWFNIYYLWEEKHKV